MHYVLTPFAWLLRTLYQVFGNYGVALILFSLITKLILLPFNAKSKKSMMKTSRLGPQLKELEKKYGDDKLKYQQAVSALYKKENVSPTGGCLWSLLPLILLMALYYVIRQPMTYLMQLSADQISQISTILTGLGVDLSTTNKAYQEIVLAQHVYQNIDAIKAVVPDIANRAIDFSFLGINLAQIPSWRWILGGSYTLAGFGLWIIPILSAVSNFLSMQISQKLNGSVATNDKGEKDADAAAAAAQSMKTMMWIMPLFSLWIGFSMPASMCVYWIAQAVFNTILDGLLTVHYRKVYDAEDAVKREKAAEEAAIEAEKEARRAERRAANPEGVANPNTSRRKVKKQLKAAENTEFAGLGKLTEEQKEDIRQKAQEKELAKGGLSGDPNRPYSRGRAYDPARFGAAAPEASQEAPEASDDAADPE